eukprot:m.50322 g.50322  ORF g.50322 m.50322 type:complete len:326 (-) comp21259_c1_seq1:115-1092(-)
MADTKNSSGVVSVSANNPISDQDLAENTCRDNDIDTDRSTTSDLVNNTANDTAAADDVEEPVEEEHEDEYDADDDKQENAVWGAVFGELYEGEDISEGEWVTDDDEEDNCDSIATEEEGADQHAFELRCTKCASILSSRAMSVMLCADASKKLYSVDVVPSGVLKEIGQPYKIETCTCLVRDQKCTACNQRVGYHVEKACMFCLEDNNNAQYWIFDNMEHVAGVSTKHLVYELPLNHAPPERPKPTDIPDHLTCGICCDLFFDPVNVCQGKHTFCRACISREVDARGCCPLDRNPVTMATCTDAELIQVQVTELLANLDPCESHQ